MQIVQKVKNCKVTEGNDLIAEINSGIVVYIGIEIDENEESLLWIVDQISNLVSEKDEILILSQFTLLAKFKGQKPSFHLAESPSKAEMYFNKTVIKIKESFPERVKTGRFGKKLEIFQSFEEANIKVLESN